MATCDRLADTREALIACPDLQSEAYLKAREDLCRTNSELREAMRRDLGMDGPSDPEFEHYRALHSGA